MSEKTTDYFAYWIKGPRRAIRPFLSPTDPPILPKHYKHYMRIGSVNRVSDKKLEPFPNPKPLT